MPPRLRRRLWIMTDGIMVAAGTIIIIGTGEAIAYLAVLHPFGFMAGLAL